MLSNILLYIRWRFQKFLFDLDSIWAEYDLDDGLDELYGDLGKLDGHKMPTEGEADDDKV